mgnify:CR=1 FL=1
MPKIASALAAALLACAIGGQAQAQPAAPQGPGQSMLVLDASGSMWGQIGGKPKIEIAREAVASMLQSWPASQQLGLMAYGHRSKGNCADIGELDTDLQLVKVATLKDAINEALRAWISSQETTHYCFGTAAGPHPFPLLVRELQSVIGRETRAQMLEKTGPRESYVGQRSGLFFQNDATRETLSDQAIRERKALSLEFDYTTISGRQLRITARSTPFYNLDGTLLGSIAFWNDLTEIYNQKSRIEAQNAAIAQAAHEASQVVEHMANASKQLSDQDCLRRD